MKRVRLEPVKTILGKPFRIPDMDSDSDEPKIENTTKLIDLLRLVVFNIPRQKLTMKDSIEGARLIEQLSKAEDGIVAIEDEEYKWIKKQVEEHAPTLFGINAVQIDEALDNFQRLHEPKDKKGKRKEKVEAEEIAEEIAEE